MIEFHQLCSNCIYVDQSNIIVSKQPLYTSHVGTCSVLLFSFKKLNFMAHIDAIQNNSDEIVKKIKKHFNIEDLKKTKIYIIKGAWCHNKCPTTNIIMKSLKTLNLNFIIYEKKINWNNEIHINNTINII